MLFTIILSLVIASAATAVSVYAGPLGNEATLALFTAATLLAAIPATLVRGTSGGKAKSSAKSKRTRTTSRSSSGRRNGTIKWFNVSKGFGFITADDGEEIFVYFKSIQGSNRRDVRQGASVSFHVGQSAKGPQAEDVQIDDT